MILEYFLVLAVIFEIFHAWEEYHFVFKNVGSTDNFVGGINLVKKFRRLSQDQSNLLIYKIMMVVMMFLITLIVAGGGFRITALSILGIYFTYQLHHIWGWILGRKYNPGLITSLLWLPVVIFWWKYFVITFL